VDGGENALAELDRAVTEGHSFALALLDVMMPHMDGFELTRTIRQRPDGATMRILLLTSAGSSDQEAMGHGLDISRILLKPVKHSDLLEAITDALGVTAAERGVTEPSEHAGEIVARQVLLVEDNPINQRVAKDLLTRRGHCVEVAQNGAQAVDLVSREHFDVVLMDIHMPVMDGLTATRTIRENEHGKGAHIPIVAMTAGATTEDQEHCFAAGMDAFLTKPFRASALYRVVEDVPVRDAAPGRQRQAIKAAPLTSGDDEPCLDWQGALKILENDEGLLIELVEMYFDQFPVLMAEIEEAIAGSKASDLQRAAHTLKGSANIIGGRAVAAAALRLEHIGRDAELDAAPPALRALKAKVPELEAALRAAVQQRAPAIGGD
jgi:CheY-like chemotaxis protein